MKLTIETLIEDRLPKDIVVLLSEVCKSCNVDIWVTVPSREGEEDGDGHGV